MPALARSDRRLLVGAAVTGIVFIAIIALFGPAEETSVVPTIYSSESGGARAAYLLLRDLQYDIHVWEKPPTDLQSLPTGAMLILAEPADSPSAGERTALRSFVEKGGRVLFCGPSVSSFFAHTKVMPALVLRPWTEFPANLPAPVTRDAGRITMRPDTYWQRTRPSQVVLYGSEQTPVVVSWQLGLGEILWWASATPLTNAGISQTGNLNLFLNSVAGAAPDHITPIYWDEYFHGQRPTLAGFFEKTPLIWAGAQLLMLMLALLLTFSRRSGPVLKPRGVSRLSPLEFVDTMGALYQHAKASAIPVEVSYKHLKLQLTRRLGLPAATPDADLARAAAARLGLNEVALAQALRDGSGAPSSERKLRSREALAIVRNLEAFLVPVAPRKPDALKPDSEEKH